MKKSEMINFLQSDFSDVGYQLGPISKWNSNYGLQIGELAFPDDNEFLIDDIMLEYSQLNSKHIESITFNQPCSKSGTIVHLTFKIEVNLQNYLVENGLDEYYIDTQTSYKELLKGYQYSKKLIRDFKKMFESVKMEVDKVTKLVESYAIGKRVSCMSNGEVVFAPTQNAGYSQLFTPYYNPNVE